MGKVRRALRCYHCGAVLQTTNKKDWGYIDPTVLKNISQESHQVFYCDSCFEKMKYINDGKLEQDVDDEILKILDDAVASDSTIVWVVDLFAFNGTLNLDVVKKIKKLNVVVVGTKYDLIEKRVSKESIIEFINERFHEVGIDPASVQINSANNEILISEFVKSLEKIRNGHDVYMIGSKESGKTSLITRMLKNYVNKTKHQIKHETFPGTSVQLLEIPLTRTSFLFELPGFSLVNSAIGKVEKDVQKILIPNKEVKITKSNLRLNEVFYLGGLCAFSLIKGKTTPVKFYTAEKVEFKSVKDTKAGQFLDENVLKRTVRPVSDRFTNILDFDVFEYTMENDGLSHDIGVTGIGWMSFEAKGQIIRVYVPKGTAIKESLSKVRKDVKQKTEKTVKKSS